MSISEDSHYTDIDSNAKRLQAEDTDTDSNRNLYLHFQRQIEQIKNELHEKDRLLTLYEQEREAMMEDFKR